MEKCVIVSYGRSAIGRATKGTLATVNPVDFGAEVLKGVVKKVPNLKEEDIDDVIVGCAIPEGKMGLNPARNIVLRAGLSDKVPGQTVNRFCSSGLQTVALGASMIISGMQDVVVAGGVESMSCDNLSDKKEFLNEYLLNNTEGYVPMGITAENVAKKYSISRVEMEEMAVESHAKASKAVEDGLFDKEIIAVKGFDKEGNEVEFKRDEGYRKGTNLEALANLNPCFLKDGLVTAATSSQRSDGAAFVVLMSETKAKELGVKPIAEFVSFAVTGLEPELMGLGPISATQKLLEKTGYSLDDIDVVEINEAFASQAIASIRELGLDEEKVNPRGGALALGHPLGATGGVLICKALGYLQDTNKKTALITMCIGGGMGAAGLIKMYE
ncbi:MAG: thiolase family protein [Lachnospirales bacterium]